MKRALLITLTIILLLSILVLVPSEVTLAEVVPIPMDKTKMDPINEKYYLSETEYQDPSLHITMERGTWTAPFRSEKNNYVDHHQGETVTTNYWVIRIQVADASQLRTGVNRARERDKWWFSHVNPVLAINGDGYSDNFNGYGRHIVRQGKLIKHNAAANKDGFDGFDALIIDDKGDFHIIRKSTEEDFAAFEGTVINCFSFGPALIVDGKIVEDITENKRYSNMFGAEINARRVCIAQTGPLSYIIVQSDGPDDPDHTGLWIRDFAELVYSLGDVQCAYNLDGGSSVRVLFHGKSIDSPYPNTKSQKRPNADMIYFASAWQE